MGSTGITILTGAAAGLWPFFVAALLAGGAAARAQSALDGFDPNANGPIHAVVVQPDGKILIGGEFTTVAPNGGAAVTRNRIARLNADGTLDLTFNPGANGNVFAIALQADGKILVGGFFTSIGVGLRTNIARLNTNGTVDSFNPNADNGVASIVVQPDGRILACGSFTIIGGQPRNRIARLDPTTGLADSFNPNANNLVIAVALQPDGKILAGGAFNGANSIGGQTRNRIARLDPISGLADSFNPNANGFVFSLALQADGKILVGGTFSGTNSIGGQSRDRLARLDPITGLADSLNPNASSQVDFLTVQADGKILAGGTFNSIGGATRNRLARLDPITGLADSFDPNATGVGLVEIFSIAVQPDGRILVGGNFTTLSPNGGAAVTRNNIARLATDGRAEQTLNLGISAGVPAVYAIALQPDGKILIGGVFNTVLGVTRNNIARLNTDGTLDMAFNPNANLDVRAIVVQADGRILVGGLFSSIGGQNFARLARLNLDGTLDTTFNPIIATVDNVIVCSIVVQPNGKILVGGVFTSVLGQTRNNIARLNSNGTLDTAFNPNADSEVITIAVEADGHVLVGGNFTNVSGQAHNFIARLDPTTGVAEFFPGANERVYALAIQADGRILAGGVFTFIGGQAHNHIARLNATTGLADSFDPNANDYVGSIVEQADGKILVGGAFTLMGGTTRNRIARLNSAGTVDLPFNPNANFDVYGLALQGDGKVLVGGAFTLIGGQSRNVFARLNNNTLALQNLAVSQNTVTWTRGGSSPQFRRVTFERSSDNVSYTFLGNGTISGTNWTLTGLNLPLEQNLFIRARGYHGSGVENGSESITESVRNAFLTLPPPRLSIQRSANTNVVLSWATNFTGFTLQANTNLNTNAWSTVIPAPAVSGTNNVVTNVATEAQKFYRLSK